MPFPIVANSDMTDIIGILEHIAFGTFKRNIVQLKKKKKPVAFENRTLKVKRVLAWQ